MNQQTGPKLEQLLLTPAQVATMLQVSQRSVHYLIQTKRLRSVKLGKARRVPKAAVEELARRGCGSITLAPEPRDGH